MWPPERKSARVMGDNWNSRPTTPLFDSPLSQAFGKGPTVNDAVNHYLGSGFPAYKLNLGVPSALVPLSVASHRRTFQYEAPRELRPRINLKFAFHFIVPEI